MVILHYRSTYLRRILSTNKKKNDGTLIHIKLPNILPEIFQIILRYIYSGKISLEKYDTSDIIKILVAGSKLGLQELITYLQFFLIETKANWMEQNFDLICKTSFENDYLLELRKFCTDLTSKEPDKIFKSLNFSSISEKLLVSLIQSDNLKMNQIQVWEGVLRWGLSQNPGLPSDPINFSKEDFNALKNSLQLRGTRDGFTANKFHETCDNQSHTVTIIKVKNSKEILGGYNPIEWKSDKSYGITKESFIFSIKNSHNFESYILSRIENEECAILNNNAFGPSFGAYGDLKIHGTSDNYHLQLYFKTLLNQIKKSRDPWYNLGPHFMISDSKESY
ncbi:BTB/POZ protein [Rhizophagus irregularis DAOM 181602=DAOM 197198]|nr:BTB/POZ protein [Rhizophagus irregularis DAOM 181602=DAOM 197198]